MPLTLHDKNHVERSLCMQKMSDLGLQGCPNKLVGDAILCMSLAVRRVLFICQNFFAIVIA